MKLIKHPLLFLSGFMILCLSSLTYPENVNSRNSDDLKSPGIQIYSSYKKVIQKTTSMIRDPDSQNLARRHGLNILNVTWEDTGRYKNSSVGPNISDMTIQVAQKNPDTGRYEAHLMPVIRHPNFSDKTADIQIDHFYLLVGNEKNKTLKKITLKEYLKNFREYLHDSKSWKGGGNSLLAKRDSHVLVSAQACFLPIPPKGEAKFNPVIFNYQSYRNDPAVLTILSTREGTSATVIDNVRDGFESGGSWGQRLFFNQNGEKAAFTGTRLSDFKSSSSSGSKSSVITEQDKGLNMVLLIQIPLKQKHPMNNQLDGLVHEESVPAAGSGYAKNKRSNVEAAVIGHGKTEGPYTEIDSLEIERDPDFPVRVTVQFYKATSNGIVSQKDMQDVHNEISRVYSDADYTGSLVTAGNTERPTEYKGSKREPEDWWEKFYHRFYKNLFPID
ncbi:MAG: hypothetical protein OEZ34_14695 [Spirochaetia bacterium]|nr:hypothetical protein [Spirochaetia bacterium]